MSYQTTLIAGAVAALSLTLAACDVKKTQEGNITVPKYEVEKKQEGSVTLPKYDVTAPEVKVGTTTTEVNVPKITTEKETITVPVIGVKTGEEKAAEKNDKK